MPTSEYNLLIRLKEMTGKSIRSLVSEGVRLVLLEYADSFGRKELLKEQEEIEYT